jgi:predicted DsbA family dithiol-disulfide isomerase
VPKSDLIDERMGDMTPEQRATLFNRMNQIGRAVGIIFKPGGLIGSTRDAHRLVHLSQTKSPEIQNALVNNILQAYHEMEKGHFIQGGAIRARRERWIGGGRGG